MGGGGGRGDQFGVCVGGGGGAGCRERGVRGRVGGESVWCWWRSRGEGGAENQCGGGGGG